MIHHFNCSLADHSQSLLSVVSQYIYPLRHSFPIIQPCVSSAFRDELLSYWRKRKCGQIMLHNLKQEHCGHVLRVFPFRIFNRKFHCGAEEWTQLGTWSSVFNTRVTLLNASETFLPSSFSSFPPSLFPSFLPLSIHAPFFSLSFSFASIDKSSILFVFLGTQTNGT